MKDWVRVPMATETAPYGQNGLKFHQYQYDDLGENRHF